MLLTASLEVRDFLSFRFDVFIDLTERFVINQKSHLITPPVTCICQENVIRTEAVATKRRRRLRAC